MAKTGFRYPKVCKITETNGVEALETGFQIGKGVKVSITPKTAKKIMFGDDGPAESANMFTGGDGTLEIDEISLENLAKIAGATVSAEVQTKGEVTYAIGDTPPFFRYGHIGRILKNNVVSYRVTVYAKVQFSIPQEELETQGEEISLKTASLSMTLFRNLEGKWRWQQEFATLAAAETYLNSKVAITV
ncbi:MAG: hypothetical protein RR185_04035 [Angelakisella sp.]